MEEGTQKGRQLSNVLSDVLILFRRHFPSDFCYRGPRTKEKEDLPTMATIEGCFAEAGGPGAGSAHGRINHLEPRTDVERGAEAEGKDCNFIMKYVELHCSVQHLKRN